jgi:hypothetical protein
MSPMRSCITSSKINRQRGPALFHFLDTRYTIKVTTYKLVKNKEVENKPKLDVANAILHY